MANTVFRLYKGGPLGIQDWNATTAFPYDTTARATIVDPEGSSVKNEITSIPSPFARIDLVKMAFREVCRSKDLDGTTIFHKMVSDTLDVGEIFFNIEKNVDKIEIITWDCHQGVDELKNSDNPGHKCFGDALEKYLESDAATYNFNKLKNIYLLNYKHGPAALNIIGATSPASVFFSTANKLDYIDDIFFGEDKPFDDKYMPLYKRADKEYIKSWFALKNSIPQFSTLFREVNDYLDLTFSKIKDNSFRQQLTQIDRTANGFGVINVKTEHLSNNVEVLGFDLLRKNATEIFSGFEMTSAIYNGKTPLALPVESGNRYADVPYTTGLWGKENHAPYYEQERNVNQRRLPFDGSSGAYLTISDFLEDNIVRVPHKLNGREYFDGNIILEDDHKLSYLLPLKKEFFLYFTPEELRKGLPTGENMIEMCSVGMDSVKVDLRIPIRGDGRDVHYIEYSRIYYGGNNRADIINNKGGIIDFDFAGFVMPLIKFDNPSDAYYVISCISSFSKSYELTFYKRNEIISRIETDCRNTSERDLLKSTTYTIDNTNFDYIQISDRSNSAVIIPKFKPQVSNEQFKFAVDLGTSNTHIEYLKSDEINPSKFSFDVANVLVSKFFEPSYFRNAQEDLILEDNLINEDYIPSDSDEFGFPTRTVLGIARDTDWQRAVRPLGLVNIPFTFNKRVRLAYNKADDNIKWGKDVERKKMETYIDCLMLMMRNMVLVNNGKLNETSITWFYPISMSPKRIDRLKDAWDTAYHRFFSNEGSTHCMTESEAPIQYYFRSYAETTNLINIDIGGGTTDVAFAKDKDIKFVTSFRFAANALFEDSFSDVNTHNGIIDNYKISFKSLFERQAGNNSNLSDLKNILLANEGKTANTAMFLFSLKDSSLAVGLNKSEIDFSAKLRDDEQFKIEFVIFYAAIIYHVAQIVKVKNLDMPRHITFSGNGSKVLTCLTSSENRLADITKIIFKKVLGRPYTGKLDILGFGHQSDSKESTCKGGLMTKNGSPVGKEKIVILKADNSSFVSNETYESISDDYIEEAVKEVRKFFSFVLNDLNKEFDLDENFGVSLESLNIAKKICADDNKDIKTYIEKGLQLMKDDYDLQSRINETLFFYPIKGVLQLLSTQLKENK